MFHLFRKSQSAALAPLVELAANRHGYDREHFLTELRADAPTVAALVEQAVAEREAHAQAHAQVSSSGGRDARTVVVLVNAPPTRRAANG